MKAALSTTFAVIMIFGHAAYAQNDATRPQAPTAWNVETQTNPIDDTANEVFAFLRGAPYRGSALGIMVRCMADKTEFFIAVAEGIQFMPFSEYIGGDIEAKVRFDKESAFTNGGSASTDGDAYFLTNSIPLIKRLADAKTLALEVTTKKAQFISTFEIGNFRPIAQQVADACH